jgi:F-box protein 9
MEGNAELESFRRQWREEVFRRAKASSPGLSRPLTGQDGLLPTNHGIVDGQEAYSRDTAQQNYREFVQQVEHLSVQPVDEGTLCDVPPNELRLPHSDVEKEKVVGELNESLGTRVASPSNTQQCDALDASTNISDNASQERTPLSTSELIASFAVLGIPKAEPIIENTPPPPCPIADLPPEVLIEVLRHVALMDPASFCRLSLVCKRSAYHFTFEQHIWKQLCQGWRFGFEGMLYSFACDIAGDPIAKSGPRYTPFPRGASLQIPRPLATWSEVFQTFPRIRYTGIYISIVSYARPGAASPTQNLIGNSPVHIVTYYRYLRFYPDGTVISLLTTTDPMTVVPYISKENVVPARSLLADTHHQHQRQKSELNGVVLDPAASTNSISPSAMATLKHALRGRWHLTCPTPVPDGHEEERNGLDSSDYAGPPRIVSDPSRSPDPRDLIIETEGVDPKYNYTLHLSLRSSNKSRNADSILSKNNKLIWKGYWSYNKLTDDWAEFGLRYDRSFVFRRVRGWGME